MFSRIAGISAVLYMDTFPDVAIYNTVDMPAIYAV